MLVTVAMIWPSAALVGRAGRAACDRERSSRSSNSELTKVVNGSYVGGELRRGIRIGIRRKSFFHCGEVAGQENGSHGVGHVTAGSRALEDPRAAIAAVRVRGSGVRAAAFSAVARMGI